MEKITKFLKISSLSLSLITFSSCGAGIDYDPNTATLTFIPAEIAFGDLRPDVTANELYTKALDYDKAGKKSRAYKAYKKVLDEYPTSTKAPSSAFRLAQYDEAKGKRSKAFAGYQKLISTYMGTPLYSAALERQRELAHTSATGEYKKQVLFFSTRVSATEADKMLDQLIKNAPQSQHAAKSQYLRGQLAQENKLNDSAIAKYRTVSRNYPESPYAGEALFQIGSIHYQQSRTGKTNTDDARTAINVFEELITLFPSHNRVKEAKALKATIQNYDISRSLEVAEFYEKKKQYTSALFYYNDIIARTPASSSISKKAKARVSALEQLVPN